MQKIAIRHGNSHAKHVLNAKVLKRLQNGKGMYEHLQGNASAIVAKSIKKAKTKSVTLRKNAKRFVVKHPYTTLGVIVTSCMAIGLYLFNRK